MDFLEVLDAERTALTAELLHSQSRTDEATSLVAVYKRSVPGGGTWLTRNDRPSQPRHGSEGSDIQCYEFGRTGYAEKLLK